MRRILAVFVAEVLALTSLAGADLPVREVVLYKHGVGYFERSGHLAAGESAHLDFQAGEMNDVLKSLTIEEKGGGKIAGLRYDSSQPLGAKLAEFPFRLGESQPLSAVLDQLKGARLELKFAAETTAGAIVAARRIPGDAKQSEREQITLLTDTGDLRNFDLAAASSVRFTDPTLQSQFKEYLAALTQSRSKDKRSVYIDSSDARAREITAGYMIPTPVWKSSYRLIFDETAQPMLEGWAIVDNTTGEDWTNVHLSLVSGRPISFISALYEPRYVTRRTAGLPDEEGQAPVIYQGTLDEMKKAQVGTGVAGGAMASRMSPRTMAAAPMAAPQAEFLMDSARDSVRRNEMSSSIAATAAATELGELFEYRIASAVNIRKSESAMLPFLQQKVAGRKLLIYSDSAAIHPQNAVEITNASGKTLDGGPITVYDAGAYAGEALVETVKAGDKRLVSYAIDLGTRITTQFDSKGDLVREIHFRRGILTARTAAVETRTYTIRNVDQKAKTLIIEHPARPGYALLERKPTEKTSNAYRFEVKLGADSTEKFPVVEERVYDNSMALTNLTPDMLSSYIQNRSLSEGGRKALEQIAALKRQIAANDAEAHGVEGETNTLVSDQNRIRQNINSLNQVNGQQQQVQTYARELAQQESQLATLRDKASGLRRSRTNLESQLSSAIEKMEF